MSAEKNLRRLTDAALLGVAIRIIGACGVLMLVAPAIAPTQAAEALPLPPSELSVIASGGLAILVDGGAPAPDHARISAGIHGVGVTDSDPAGGRHATGTRAAANIGRDIDVGSGCNALLLAYRPSGVTGDIGIVTGNECPTPRPRVGFASIRLAVAMTTGAVPSGIGLSANGTPLIDPITAASIGTRVDIKPGRIDLAATVEDKSIRTMTATIEPGNAYTLVFLVGGEIPATFKLINDGVSTPQSPDASDRINTDIPRRSPSQPLVPRQAWLAAVPLALCRQVFRTRRSRHAHTSLAFGLLLALSCCAAPRSASNGLVTENRVVTETTLARTDAERVPESSNRPKTITLPGLAAAPIDAIPISDVSMLPSELPADRVAHLGGDAGNFVFAGHVNGPFGSLKDLGLGDQITVSFGDATTAVFAVDGEIIRPKNEPWTAAWAPTRPAILVLITCTGPIEQLSGLHADNLWITARRLPAGVDS